MWLWCDFANDFYYILHSIPNSHSYHPIFNTWWCLARTSLELPHHQHPAYHHNHITGLFVQRFSVYYYNKRVVCIFTYLFGEFSLLTKRFLSTSFFSVLREISVVLDVKRKHHTQTICTILPLTMVVYAINLCPVCFWGGGSDRLSA